MNDITNKFISSEGIIVPKYYIKGYGYSNSSGPPSGGLGVNANPAFYSSTFFGSDVKGLFPINYETLQFIIAKKHEIEEKQKIQETKQEIKQETKQKNKKIQNTQNIQNAQNTNIELAVALPVSIITVLSLLSLLLL